MLFLQALLALVVSDILIAVRPFSSLYKTVKRWKVKNARANKETADRVCTAVNFACALYPKRALCLQRSFITTYLLRKHGVDARMVIGAKKLPFKAHAWVEVEGHAINEQSDVQAIYGVWDRC